eukprot:13392731-Alexandrium_andersonii.AAC.1
MEAEAAISNHIQHGEAFHWHARSPVGPRLARVTLPATAHHPTLRLEFPAAFSLRFSLLPSVGIEAAAGS